MLFPWRFGPYLPLRRGDKRIDFFLLTCTARREGNKVINATPDDTPQVTCTSGLTVYGDLKVSEACSEYDVLVIPGGIPDTVIDQDEVRTLVRRLCDAIKFVAVTWPARTFLTRADVHTDPSYNALTGEECQNLFDGRRVVEDVPNA